MVNVQLEGGPLSGGTKSNHYLADSCLNNSRNGYCRKFLLGIIIVASIWNQQRNVNVVGNSSSSRNFSPSPSTASNLRAAASVGSGGRDLSTTNPVRSQPSEATPQTKTNERLSYEELMRVLSPPGVDHSALINNKKSVKGVMIKCNIDYWAHYIMRELYYLYDGLTQIYGWQEINLAELRELAYKEQESNNQDFPDVIFLCEPAILKIDILLPWLSKIKSKHPQTQIVYHTDDLQSAMNKVDTDILAQAFGLFDTYMGTYAYKLRQYLWQVPISNEKMPDIVWIPHSVSPEFFGFEQNDQYHNNNSNTTSTSIVDPTHNDNDIKRDRIILPGKINDKYPIRMWAEKGKRHGNPQLQMLDVLAHAGYTVKHNQTQQLDFASSIGKYATAFTCASKYHYIVAKMFEIPAVGTLLLVNNDVAELMKSLGFEDGIHYKTYSSINPIPALEWSIDSSNQNSIDQMRKAGKDLVFRKHQVGHRLHAMMSYFVNDRLVKYPIPNNFKDHPCPMIDYYPDDESKCLAEYRRTTTKPLLPAL